MEWHTGMMMMAKMHIQNEKKSERKKNNTSLNKPSLSDSKTKQIKNQKKTHTQTGATRAQRALKWIKRKSIENEFRNTMNNSIACSLKGKLHFGSEIYVWCMDFIGAREEEWVTEQPEKRTYTHIEKPRQRERERTKKVLCSDILWPGIGFSLQCTGRYKL